ncbi:hypothetical protein OS493_039551, partial [Desmophyllum pertusum]
NFVEFPLGKLGEFLSGKWWEAERTPKQHALKSQRTRSLQTDFEELFSLASRPVQNIDLAMEGKTKFTQQLKKQQHAEWCFESATTKPTQHLFAKAH